MTIENLLNEVKTVMGSRLTSPNDHKRSYERNHFHLSSLTQRFAYPEVDDTLKQLNVNHVWKSTPARNGKKVILPSIVYDSVVERIPTNELQTSRFFGAKKLITEDEHFNTDNLDAELDKMRARIQRQQKLIKNTKVASMLYDEIQTNNEQLKFEYVEIVKNGLEDEHLLDLLKGNFVENS